MAKATVLRHAPPPQPLPAIKEVLLTLSAEEAQVLADVTNFIGGNPIKTRRRLLDNIRQALHAAGVKAPHMVSDINYAINGQGVWFDEVTK
jgi:hypothetical protein